jgi:ABC-2 type transport system permease protein
MKLVTVFLKTCREMSRDWLVVSLSVVFAPFFVLLYWIWFSGGSTAYNVLVINNDVGALLSDGTTLAAGEEVIQAIRGVQYADDKPLLKVMRAVDRAEVDHFLREREVVAFLLIPEDFSRAIQSLQEGDRTATPQIVFGGDLTNPYYTVGSVLALTALESYVQQATGQQPLIHYIEQPLGASAARTEFEIYVPGVMVFAVIMLIFLAAMTVAREVETGTLRRLIITPMTSFDLLGGISAALVLVGVASVVLTFITAVALGFHSQGPMWVAMLVGAVTSLSIIGMGMVVACFSRSVSQAFVIANFPLGLLMFFTGAIFPVPQPTLFEIGEHTVGLFDLLPPTHAVVALNKVLTLGVGLEGVLYELTALLVLSLGYFALGCWLFQRIHMR